MLFPSHTRILGLHSVGVFDSLISFLFPRNLAWSRGCGHAVL